MAQEDFGGLGLPNETDDINMLDIAAHSSLSRRSSEKSLVDTGESGEAQDRSCEQWSEAFAELLLLFSNNTLQTSDSSIQAHDAFDLNGHDAIPVFNTAEEHRHPPRRYPRRFWIGLVTRMLRRQRLSMMQVDTEMELN